MYAQIRLHISSTFFLIKHKRKNNQNMDLKRDPKNPLTMVGSRLTEVMRTAILAANNVRSKVFLLRPRSLGRTMLMAFAKTKRASSVLLRGSSKRMPKVIVRNQSGRKTTQ